MGWSLGADWHYQLPIVTGERPDLRRCQVQEQSQTWDRSQDSGGVGVVTG